MIRKLIPYSFRLSYKLVKRALNDLSNKELTFAKNTTSIEKEFKYYLSTKQVIRQSHLYQNKIHNLKLGKEKIETYLIRPNETFSFWKAIGKPTEKNGYKKGRNIINGVLSEDIGGGLCQLSGIIYHTALIAGLKITERFNHTVDIYKEDERLSPLGTDATVVFGYKDLRIKNQYRFAIKFAFEIYNDSIICHIKSEKPIKPKTILFERNEKDKVRLVQIKYLDDEDSYLASSKYLVP